MNAENPSTLVLAPAQAALRESHGQLGATHSNGKNGHGSQHAIISIKPIVYPDSDGQPMADNTEHYNVITTFQANIADIFKDDLNIFIAGDLLWYPVVGDNRQRLAPDVMVAFGRPQGRRGSYKQWEEDNISPHVVFEIISPSNHRPEMAAKWEFYDRHGVEEYYEYDPQQHDMCGWIRQNGRLRLIHTLVNWVSPRLQIRFEQVEDDWVLYRPDGQRFLTYTEMSNRASAESRRADDERRQKERLIAQLQALGIQPEL